MPGTVLLVDDDASLLKLYTFTLQQAGYTVTAAANLEEAYAHLDVAHYDVLIIDMLVGNDSGLSLLKDRVPSLTENGTRIVAISSDWSFQHHVIETGVRYFMVKPISRTALIEVVRNLVENHNAGEE